MLGRLAVGAALSPLLPVDRTYGAPATDPHQMDPSQMRLLEVLCDGRPVVLMLRRDRIAMSSGHAAVQGQLGRHVPQRQRRQGLSRQLHGLLRPLVVRAVLLQRQRGRAPRLQMGSHNDVNWCMANGESSYHCTISVIVGTAD